MMLEVGALVFDLDGTLADSSQDIANSVNYALDRLGLAQKSKAEVEKYIGDGMKTLLLRATGRNDVSLIQSAMEIFKSHYLDHCADFTALYPGVLETLEELKGKKMALASNKPEAMIQKVLERLRIRKYFEVVLGPESTRAKKPHPEPLLKSLELLGEQAGSSMIVGDGTTDIQAGKSAGMLTCAVAYGFRTREELQCLRPDFLIQEIRELIPIVH